MLILIMCTFIVLRSNIIYAVFCRFCCSFVVDKTLSTRFAKQIKRCSDNQNVMIGSSTIAWMTTTFKNTKFMNLGVPSLCASHILQNVDSLNHMNVNIAIVYIGVNDMIRRTDTDSIASNICELLTILKANHIIYIPIIESNYQHFIGKNRINDIQAINNQVERLTVNSDNITIVTPKFSYDDFKFDGLHLNKRGNRHMKHVIEHAMTYQQLL
jgi:lysophospholipase L1-like esterase